MCIFVHFRAYYAHTHFFQHFTGCTFGTTFSGFCDIFSQLCHHSSRFFGLYCVYFIVFYQRCARALPAEPPPSIHLVEYTSSAAATAHKQLGTEHTHIIPVNAPPPLWWQPSYHHKMPQSPACLDNSTKFRECLLKNGFVCLHTWLFFILVYLIV